MQHSIPSIFDRRTLLLEDLSTKGVVTYNPLTSNIGFKLLNSTPPDVYIVGNKIDHIASQVDVFNEDLDLLFFQSIASGSSLEYLPGTNYGNLIIYIQDKAYTICGKPGTVIFAGYCQITDSSLLTNYITINIVGLTFQNPVNTTNKSCFRSLSTGANYKYVTIILRCMTLYNDVPANKWQNVVQIGIKSPHLEIHDSYLAVFHYGNTALGVVEEMINMNDIQETNVTVESNIIEFLLQDDKGNIRFTIIEDEGTVTGNTYMKFKNNICLWTNYGTGVTTYNFSCHALQSTALGTAKNYYISDNVYKLENNLYNAASNIIFYGVSVGPGLGLVRMTGNIFNTYDLRTGSQFYVHYDGFAGTSALTLEFIDNVIELRDSVFPTIQAGPGTPNLNLKCNSMFDGNRITYNLNSDSLVGYTSYLMNLPGSATGVNVIWDNVTKNIYYLTSSKRLKKNIQPPNLSPSKIINKIEVKDWQNVINDRSGLSFILEDIAESSLPQKIKDLLLFFDDDDNPISYDLSSLVFLLLMNVQELNAKVDFMKKY